MTSQAGNIEGARTVAAESFAQAGTGGSAKVPRQVARHMEMDGALVEMHSAINMLESLASDLTGSAVRAEEPTVQTEREFVPLARFLASGAQVLYGFTERIQNVRCILNDSFN